MRAFVLQFIRYALVSALAFGVDVAILGALVKLAGWHYLAASAVSFIAGGVVAYVLCVRFVFPFRRIDARALELSYFVALGAAGLAVNSVAMYAAVELGGMNFLLAKVGAAGCTFAANFLLRRYFLFSPLEPRLDS